MYQVQVCFLKASNTEDLKVLPCCQNKTDIQWFQSSSFLTSEHPQKQNNCTSGWKYNLLSKYYLWSAVHHLISTIWYLISNIFITLTKFSLYLAAGSLGWWVSPRYPGSSWRSLSAGTRSSSWSTPWRPRPATARRWCGPCRAGWSRSACCVGTQAVAAHGHGQRSLAVTGYLCCWQYIIIIKIQNTLNSIFSVCIISINLVILSTTLFMRSTLKFFVSSSEKPPPWRIFICFKNVDFPASPVPSRRIFAGLLWK